MFKAFDLLRFEADKGTGEGETPVTPPAQQAATFTQADIDRIVTERLEREKRKGDEAAKKSAEDAAAKALKDNAQFKELSEKQAQAILDKETALHAATTQAETVTQERDKYKSALEQHVKERRTGLPDHITALLDVLDPVAQLEWLSKNAEKLTGTNREGVPPTPKAQGNLNEAQRQQAQTNAQGFYKNAF